MKRRTDDRMLDDGGLLEEEDPLKKSALSRPRRSGRRVWPRVLLGFLVALLLLMAVLPRLLSLAPARRLLLGKVNAALAPATLAIDDWSLRWFGGMSVSGLKFADPAHRTEAQVLKVTTSGGLFGLLPFGKVNLGTITVDAPQLSLTLPGKNLSNTMPPGKPVASISTKPAAFPVADLAVRLVVDGGRIEIAGAGTAPFVLEHVAVQADVKSVREPGSVKLAAFVPWKDDAGMISLEGSMPRPEYFLAGGTPSLEHLKLGVKQLDLQGFRALLEAFTGQPWIRSGVANGGIQLTYRGWEAAQMRADLGVANLSIEPPGQPVSPAGDVRVLAELDYANGRLQIGQLSFASPWASLRADGQFALQPDANGRRLGGVEARADIDLQAVARDFGSLLKLRNDFRVERGRLHVDAMLAGTPEALEVKVTLASSNLALRCGGEAFDLRPAPAARVNVALPYNAPLEIRELQIELPFAHVSGKGRLDSGSLRLGADLAAFTRDFRRVLTNCPALAGTLDAELKTAADSTGHLALTFAATATGLGAKWQPDRGMALNKGNLKLSARAPLVNGLPLPDLSDVQLTFDSDAGNVTASAARIMPGASNQPPVVVDGQLRAELDLAAVRRMAGPFLTALPADAALAGKLVSAITLGMAGGQAKVRANTVLQDVRLLTTAWDVREDDLRLRMCVDTEPATGVIRVFDSHLASRLTTLDVPEWQVQLPRNGQALVMKGGMKGEADLAVLSGWQRAGKSGPPPRLEGKLTFQAQGTSERRNVVVTLNAALDSFRLAATNGVPFVEPHAELTLKASLPDDARKVTLESLTLKSSLTDLDAKGAVDSPAQKPQVELGGNLSVDFGSVDKLLRARGLLYPVLSGHKPRTFALNGPLDGGPTSLLSYGRGSAAVYLESAAAFGVTAGPADLQALLAGGILKVDYQPAMNQGGKLVFTPSVELTRNPMLLSFPANARVLQNVPLTQEMLDKGLAFALPLLHGSGVLGGTVDLTLRECHVPLGPTLTNDMTFTAALSLHNLRLSPSGALGTVMDLVGRNGQEINVAQYDLTAECSHGMVKPSDLVLNVTGGKMTISGTVGLNGALSYTVVAPLSSGLVGKELAKFLEGETIRVPITGTIAAPAVDRKAVSAEIQRLIRVAVQKGAASALGGFLNDLRR